MWLWVIIMDGADLDWNEDIFAIFAHLELNDSQVWILVLVIIWTKYWSEIYLANYLEIADVYFPDNWLSRSQINTLFIW